jgi:hypothetical protein
MDSAASAHRESIRSLDTATGKLELSAQHFDRAAIAEQRATREATGAATKLERSSVLLNEATQCAMEAKALALEANQQFQSAREAELSAARLSRLTVRYAAAISAFSWIAMAWTAWFLVHTTLIFWLAAALSALLVVALVFVLKGTRIDARTP